MASDDLCMIHQIAVVDVPEGDGTGYSQTRNLLRRPSPGRVNKPPSTSEASTVGSPDLISGHSHTPGLCGCQKSHSLSTPSTDYTSLSLAPEHIQHPSLIGACVNCWESSLSRSDNRDEHKGPTYDTSRCPFPAHARLNLGLEITSPPSLDPCESGSQNLKDKSAFPGDLGSASSGVIPSSLQRRLYGASIEDRQHVFGEDTLPSRPRKGIHFLAFKDITIVSTVTIPL
jgi:hypothetical protein